MREFEFDEGKSKANLKKHGIDFHSAMELWKDPDILEIQANSDDEPRHLLIGRIGANYWSVIVTHRNEKIRLISVRRARKKEVELYEG